LNICFTYVITINQEKETKIKHRQQLDKRNSDRTAQTSPNNGATTR